MRSWQIAVPPLDARCVLTVALPARDEAARIERALCALALQPHAERFDVIVFANECRDGTAALARRAADLHPHVRIHVVEGALPPDARCVGMARRIVMDCAVDRFLAAGKPRGIVATTDADSVVAPDWIERTFEELRAVDAVAGFVEIGAPERLAMPAALRALYALDAEYLRLSAEAESLVHPRAEDPYPRHRVFVGASFAVTAEAYVRAGRLPPLPSLEDREFAAALRQSGARIRHSLRVRVATSARADARVSGGFGTFLDYLRRCAARGETFLVDDPRPLFEAGVMGDAAAGGGAAHPLLPVEEALALLRAFVASRKADAATRSTAASGAG